MISKLLIHSLPLLLPFAAYATYIVLSKRASAQGGVWTDAPWYWLVSTGLAFVIAGFVVAASIGGAPPGSSYVPAEYKDGEIVPGRFE